MLFVEAFQVRLMNSIDGGPRAVASPEAAHLLALGTKRKSANWEDTPCQRTICEACFVPVQAL